MPQGLTGHSGHTFWPTSSSPPIQLEQEKRPPPQRNTRQNGHTFWPITPRVMVGAIVRLSRFWGCGAHRVSIAEKAPAGCARKENRVGRHVILPIFDVLSHSVRRTPSGLRAKNGSILRFSAYVMRDSRYVKRLMYLLSHTSVGRQMNNGKDRVPSHRNGVRPATIGAEGTTCRPGGPRDPA